MAITADGPDLDPTEHGAKAVGLQRLMRAGLPVPPAVVVPVAVAESVTTAQLQRAARAVAPGADDRVAVRSGAAISLPGGFETVLAVEPSGVRTAMDAVARSTRTDRAAAVARALGHDAVPDTAVIIQRQVDAAADRSGAGVATSRDPITGDPTPDGSFVWGRFGDTVMQGTATVEPLAAIADRLPEVHTRLLADLARLDTELDGPVELEFAIESGGLWYLQLRTFTVGPVSPREFPAGSLVIGTGQPASAGLGRGRLHVDVDDALEAADRGEPVVLALDTTSPAEVAAMVASAAVVTRRGGRDSHAAVVTRSARVPAVVGLEPMAIGADHVVVGGHRVAAGEELLVDGSTGRLALPPTSAPATVDP